MHSMKVALEQGTANIPGYVHDHDSFRRWALSDEYPERGQFAWLDGVLWVDLSMERSAHNRIKTCIATALDTLTRHDERGLYYGDRMLLTNLDVGLSAEPDGMFISFAALDAGRVVVDEGDEGLVIAGSPDMVLEVVSPTSVEKDLERLPKLYWDAGISEYWLVDGRDKDPRLDILRRGGTKYTAARRPGGWVKSNVFDKEFQLSRREVRPGLSDFTLDVR